MSKSERTRSRYRAQWKSQTRLDAFGFKKVSSNASTCHPVALSASSNMPKLNSVDQSHNSRHDSEQAIPQVRLASGQFNSSDLESDRDQSHSEMNNTSKCHSMQPWCQSKQSWSSRYALDNSLPPNKGSTCISNPQKLAAKKHRGNMYFDVVSDVFCPTESRSGTGLSPKTLLEAPLN